MPQKVINDLQLISEVTADCNVPLDNGIQTYRATPEQFYNYIRSRLPGMSPEISNLSLAVSVGSSAATIAFKKADGSNASASDPIRIAFRSATLTSGVFNVRTVSAALSVTISSGSTAGQASGIASRLYIYAIDNAGTVEPAFSLKKFNEDELVTTVAEGGAGGADTGSTMYSTAARSNVPCRLVGYWDNTQTTAGTWASTGTKLQTAPFDFKKAPTYTAITSVGSGSYYIPQGCTWLEVEVVAGGSGGTGSSTTSAGNGGTGFTGGNSSFGTSLLSCTGAPATGFGSAGLGGAGTVNSPAVGRPTTGGGGGGATQTWTTGAATGGSGGNSPLGGGGASTINNTAGYAGVNGTGGGGAGGSCGASSISGTGGGAGGYVKAIIPNPATINGGVFATVVGDGGAAGSAGTSGQPGGKGGSGGIYIWEHYT